MSQDFQSITPLGSVRSAFTLSRLTNGVRRHLESRWPGGLLPLVVLKQAFYEQVLLRRKGIRFRAHDETSVQRAYTAMTPREFEAINARQSWANWRIIPRNLRGCSPQDPVTAIDLCCGTGHSTAVLARCLPSGSTVLGLDVGPKLIEVARDRTYAGDGDSPQTLRFAVQSVLEPFRWPAGRLVETGEAALVNSSGAVGCHFEPQATRRLAREVRRVLRPGGLALIDSGPEGTSGAEVVSIFDSLGFKLLGRARSCVFDRYWQYCFRARTA